MIDLLMYRLRIGLFHGGSHGKLFCSRFYGKTANEGFELDPILVCCVILYYLIMVQFFLPKLFKDLFFAKAHEVEEEMITCDYLYTYTVFGHWIQNAMIAIYFFNRCVMKKEKLSTCEVTSSEKQRYVDIDASQHEKEHKDVCSQNVENDKKSYCNPEEVNKTDTELPYTNAVKKENGKNITCLKDTSTPVYLSEAVQVEDVLKNEDSKKLVMIVKENKCNRLSLLDSEFISLRTNKNLKAGKVDVLWMTKLMSFLRSDIMVYYNELQVAPTTNTVNTILARYFSPNPPTKRETMAYELLRLCTLHDFPKSTGQSCIRLAQAAFFYEGKGDQVTCFSCSIQICGWQPRDIPLDRHRETSPSCLFIKCKDSGNVPISNAGYIAECKPSSSKAVHENFAMGAQAKENKEKSECVTNSPSATLVNPSVPQKSEELNESGYGSESSNLSQPNGSSRAPNNQTYITAQESSLSRTGITDTQTAAQYTVTSTNRSRAHYPEYVLVNDRLQSFNRGWPDYVRQTPQMMVESGFFFAGYEDCVRCFQCGIGLRNWEPPDSPHVEHARWSPKCPFLLGVKGQDFINLVLDAVAQLAIRNEQSGNTPPAHTESNPGKAVLLQTSPQIQQTNSARKNAVMTGTSAPTDAAGSVCTTSSQTSRSQGAAQTDAIRTEATQNIVQKGFSEGEVKKAIERIVETDGWKCVTEDRVLKTIREAKQRERLHPPGLRGGDASQKNPSQASEINELRKKNREMREMTICKICLEEEVSIVFLPCGHLVACAQCAPALSRCAVCRKPITGTVCAHLDV